MRMDKKRADEKKQDKSVSSSPKQIKILQNAKSDFHKQYKCQNVEIGRGEFGVVRKCTEIKSSHVFACKSVNKANLQTHERVDELRMEIFVMRILPKHPNVVSLIDVFEDDSFVHIVMEFCEGGDLFDFISNAKQFREPEAVWIFRKLVEAVYLCHSRGIVHLDLKPENVFISLGGGGGGGGGDQRDSSKRQGGGIELKLGDFGQALVLDRDEYAVGLAGSSFYMAPEVVRGKPYNNSADLWSLGVLLYVLLSGNLPFWGVNNTETFACICKGEVDLDSSSWSSVSTEAKGLIQSLLSSNPRHRPTITDVLDHPWMSKYRVSSYLGHAESQEFSQMKKNLSFKGRPVGVEGCTDRDDSDSKDPRKSTKGGKHGNGKTKGNDENTMSCKMENENGCAKESGTQGRYFIDVLLKNSVTSCQHAFGGDPLCISCSLCSNSIVEMDMSVSTLESSNASPLKEEGKGTIPSTHSSFDSVFSIDLDDGDMKLAMTSKFQDNDKFVKNDHRDNFCISQYNKALHFDSPGDDGVSHVRSDANLKKAHTSNTLRLKSQRFIKRGNKMLHSIPVFWRSLTIWGKGRTLRSSKSNSNTRFVSKF